MVKRIYIAPTLGAMAVPGMIIMDALQGNQSGPEAIGNITAAYTGFNPLTGESQPETAVANYMAIGIGILASMLASRFGLNKRLPKGFNI